MIRKIPLTTGEFYHIYSRSIAKFVIFNHPNEYARLRLLLAYCLDAARQMPLSNFLSQKKTARTDEPVRPDPATTAPLVRIVAWCLMPTHIHLVLQQLIESGITNFMHRVMTAYSKFFNALHKRRGPLWETRFQSRPVDDGDYFLHLTRYVHLNPVKAGLVAKPQDWAHSSYGEFIAAQTEGTLCDFKPLIPYSPALYRKFTEDHASYTTSITAIARLLMDDDTHP